MNNDASASWHGFEYQGKVTLYQVLRRINGLLDNKKSEKISSYSFLVEGEEDFDIFKDGDLIELNQVKAQYTKKNVSGYMEAIIKLYLRDSAKSNVSLKFHTVVEITDWNDKFEKHFSAELDSMKEKINSQEEKIKQKNKELGDKKTNIEESKIKGITKEDLEKECTKLSGDCEKLKEEYQKLEDAGVGDVRSKVELAAYEINGRKNYYCSSDNIEELIKFEIKNYFSKTNQKNKENDAHKFLIYLFFKVSQHIKERSEKKVTEKKIPFQHICDCLNDDKVLENDDLYYYGLVLNRFLYRSFSLYCESYCSIRATCDRKSCYLKNTLFMKLNTMSIEDGYKLLKKMFPHKILEDISLTNDAFNDESFMFIYDEFSEDCFYDSINYHLQDNYYFIKKNKIYFPTGISIVAETRKESSIEDYKKKIRQNIENKAFDIEKLYELDYLITDNLETEKDFISDRLDIEQDLISEQKRNRYTINLRKLEDVREDLENE